MLPWAWPQAPPGARELMRAVYDNAPMNMAAAPPGARHARAAVDELFRHWSQAARDCRSSLPAAAAAFGVELLPEGGVRVHPELCGEAAAPHEAIENLMRCHKSALLLLVYVAQEFTDAYDDDFGNAARRAGHLVRCLADLLGAWCDLRDDSLVSAQALALDPESDNMKPAQRVICYCLKRAARLGLRRGDGHVWSRHYVARAALARGDAGRPVCAVCGVSEASHGTMYHTHAFEPLLRVEPDTRCATGAWVQGVSLRRFIQETCAADISSKRWLDMTNSLRGIRDVEQYLEETRDKASVVGPRAPRRPQYPTAVPGVRFGLRARPRPRSARPGASRAGPQSLRRGVPEREP